MNSDTIENLAEIENLKKQYSNFVSQAAKTRRVNQRAKRAIIYAKNSHLFASLSFKNKF